MGRSPRLSWTAAQALVCAAAADVVLGGGIDALSPSTVAVRAGISKSRVVRIYSNSVQLAVGLRRTGYERVDAMFGRFPRRGDSGLDAVAACVFELVEQACTDPVVRAMLALDAAGVTAASGQPSIYGLWRRRFVALLNLDLVEPREADGALIRPSTAEVADVLCDALAGLTNPRAAPCELAMRLDQVHLLLDALIPMVCIDAVHARHLHQYLPRLRRMYGTGPDADAAAPT